VFVKIGDSRPTQSMMVRAKCSVSGDIFDARFDHDNDQFVNFRGEVIAFGDPCRPDDEWEGSSLLGIKDGETMNSHIQALAEQASLKLFNDTAQYRLLKGFAEKFAELIVRECAKTAEQHIDERCYRDFGVGVRLKEHFGVEE
jgi:hypothetical protein